MKIKDFIGNATTIEEIISKFGDSDIVLNGVSKDKFNSINNELKDLKLKSVDVETLTKQVETLTNEITTRDKQITRGKLESKLQKEGVIYPDLILNGVDLSTIDVDKFDTSTYKEQYPQLFPTQTTTGSAVSSTTGVDAPKHEKEQLINAYNEAEKRKDYITMMSVMEKLKE